MKNTCLSLVKQGWLGMPLFFVGLVSLAFSQFDGESSQQNVSPDQLVAEIKNLVSKNDAALNNLTGVGRFLDEKKSKFNSVLRNSLSLGNLTSEDRISLEQKFQSSVDRLSKRLDSTNESFSLSQSNLEDAKEIFSDLTETFAGRLEEAQSPLFVLRENILKTDIEINALSKMVDGVVDDFIFESDEIISQINAITPSPDILPDTINTASNIDTEAKSTPIPPSPRQQPSTSIGRKIASVIEADQPIAFNDVNPASETNTFAPSFSENSSDLFDPSGVKNPNDLILELKKDLAISRNVQSEMSIDAASLKSDLRKAYREIVALQNNLNESQAIINELEQTKQSFYKNEDGSRATAQMVRQKISRLEKDLESAKSELSQARQSLLLEQQRSNAMISSITTELERTRKELDFARQAVQGNGVTYDQLAMLEQELAKAKQALRSAHNQSIEPNESDYSKLQEELRKSLSEIANMEIELSKHQALKDELQELKVVVASSNGLESKGDGSGRISANYVKKLLVELGDAKEEIAQLRKGAGEQKGDLSVVVDELERKLKRTKDDLDDARQEIESNQESLAKRELDFANTIKILEEEAEIAQAVLQQAADGKISAFPFISEMEDDLAASESRIRLLSDQFAQEQKKASEVITGLQEELELAKARQKKSLDQLERRELELTGKDEELKNLNRRRKDLEEELQVVKVIAGQLQDLNKVLEETKEAQSSQSQTSDEVVDSLRDELNKAKVELVVSLEEKEKMQKEFSDKIFSLERQLDDSRNEMIEEQELFYDSSEESKNLIVELRNELKVAKSQVAKMKASGFTESVETKQAVSQLQEALGTIRILKESLEDAERTNLELDNLRADLADSMSTHLEELQNSDNEKQALAQKILDLETEIDVLREHSTHTGVAQLNESAILSQKVASTSSINKDLLRQLADAESIGISSLVDLEDEIAELRGVNEDLRSQIEQISGSSNGNKIKDLENELAQTKWKLQSLTSGSKESEEDLNNLLEVENANLREELASIKERLNSADPYNSSNALNDSEELVTLQVSLDQALARIEELESQISSGSGVGSSDLVTALEGNLIEAEQTIANLQSEIDTKRTSQSDLLAKLEDAFERIQLLESKNQPSPVIASSEWEKMEKDLDESKIKILELAEEISLLSQLQLDSPANGKPIEDVSSMQDEINSLRSELTISQEMLSSLPSENELLAMQMEIESLRQELASKDGVPEQISNPDQTELEDQLKTAVAESFDLQMELERTLDRLAQLEKAFEENSDSSGLSSSDAQARIDQLTLALQNSEQLREETEDLVVELEKKARQDDPGDFSESPEFIDLQKEMVALQNELLMLQDYEDPRLAELEEALAGKKIEFNNLQSELTNTKSEYDRLSARASALKNENSRLRNLSMNRDEGTNENSLALLNARISNLESENSALLTQLSEKEKRISGLKLDLSSNLTGGNEKLLLVQLEELRNQLTISKGNEDRYLSENRLIRDELNQMRSRLKNTQNSSSPVEANLSIELERIRSENANLKNQLSLAKNLSNRDRFEEQIRELSESNMNAQVMLNQERAVVDELKRQLADAREIKREVLERGKSSRLESDLLNDELTDARLRIGSLEQALVSARNAIRVLQDGGSVSSMIPVSSPLTTNFSSRNSRFGRTASPLPASPRGSSTLQPRFSRPSSTLFIPGSNDLPSIKNTSGGSSNLKVTAKVKFLDNKTRPAAFTEFFVVEDDLQTILRSENIGLPRSEGIQSFAEYWARSVQRGYKFPGAAAKIRNALARASLRRIKTNSLGEGNINNLPRGKYYVVGTSPLGQVGVVWSKAVSLNDGDNMIALNLADASWAQ